jgi:hypothetical protein
MHALFQQKEIQKAVLQCYTTTPLSAPANPCTFPTDPAVILNRAIIHPLYKMRKHVLIYQTTTRVVLYDSRIFGAWRSASFTRTRRALPVTKQVMF